MASLKFGRMVVGGKEVPIQPWMKQLFLALCVVIPPFFAYEWLAASMSEIAGVRELERIPPTDINALVAGKVHVSGYASPVGRLLVSPMTKTKTLYYRYLEERKSSSSKGESWIKVRENIRALPFYVEDDTGKAMVEANQTGIDQSLWFAQQKRQQIIDGRRYTEWRIDPEERINVTGLSFWNLSGPKILLNKVGNFTPVVSTLGVDAGRQHIGELAILKLWGGVSMVSLCSFALLLLLKQHRSIMFFSINTIILMAILLSMGSSMIGIDLKNQVRQLAATEKSYVAMLNGLLRLDPNQKSWENIIRAYDNQSQSESGERALAMMTQWNAVHYRLEQSLETFPDNIVADLLNVNLPSLPSNFPSDQSRFEQIRSIETTQVRPSSPWLLVFIPFFLGAGLLWFGVAWIKEKRMLENIPTSSVLGVVPGIVEVEGALIVDEKLNVKRGATKPKANSDKTYHVNDDAQDDNTLLIGPVSGRQVAWYRLVIHEKTNSWKKEESWEVVCDETAHVPVVCEDSTGDIALDLEKADVVTEHYRKEKRSNEIREEWWLEPYDSLFVIGTAKFNLDRPDALWITDDKGAPYIITNRSEEALMMEKAFVGLLTLNAAVSSWVLVGLFILSKTFGLSADIMLYAALLPLMILALVTSVLHFNDLVFLKMRVLRNEANIETLLKKRADLFPRFEKVMKGYLAHEASLQQALAGLRQSSHASKLDALSQLDGRLQAIKTLTARIEQYPELKANTVVSRLFVLLRKVEDELALIREGFLDAMKMYDTRRESFPDNLLAKMFGFKPARRLVKS